MTASSPIVIALRAASPNYIPSLRPTFGWLLRPTIQRKPSKLKVPSLSIFNFFVAASDPPKRRVNVLSHTFLPVSSPLPCPPHCLRHRSVGCCVSSSSGGHPSPVLRPSPNFSMGAIGAPQSRDPAAASPSPGVWRLNKTNREPRRLNSGPWRMIRWRGRANRWG